MTTELPKHFDFKAIQDKVYQSWLESGVMRAIPDEREHRYVIMMPLPNVTGALHMGHAMDNVMQDMLIRWHRMIGDNTLWMPGADHAGIATQAVVEKRLFELEGKSRHDIGREALVKRIWDWKDEYESRIIRQLQSIGCSCDWSVYRFTMDPVCTRAVREAFFRLFRDGLIFRGNRLVNWDCHLQTAVSDDEIVRETIQGHFWHVRYPVVNPKKGEPDHITVATTRPETMLGDTAVAVHPDPEAALEAAVKEAKNRKRKSSSKELPQLQAEIERIKARKKTHLPLLLTLARMAGEGRKVRLPLLNREIPLILDEWAKPELGSGCVKITPAHDPNDYDVWQRHKSEIDIINLLNPDGTYNENAGTYAGLDRFKVREKVLEDLQDQGLIEAVEDHEIELGHSDRSKTVIEPFLSKQWFIRMGDVEGGVLFAKGSSDEFRAPGLAQAAIDAVSEDWKSSSGRRLTFHPDSQRYGGTYRNWLSEKRDWCISRQLWWGHQIPIWHGSVQRAELDKVESIISNDDRSMLWSWVADADGNLLPSVEMKGDGPFELLVCIQNQDGEKRYSTILEKAGLERDPDVLDTWFSSALWPFSTLGWPDPETAEVGEGQTELKARNGHQDYLSYYYPGSCLITGRDIITLWVARMQVMGLYLLGDVPFTDCFIHANIQDGKGERMSKSKGNGIDPVDIIDEYGTDAMRYVLCDMQTGTQDIKLPVQAVSPYTGDRIELAEAEHGRSVFTFIDPTNGKEFDVLGTIPELPKAKITSDRFDTGRSFCTKLWNAVRFSLMNLGEYRYQPVTMEALEPEDRWILSRLSNAVAEVTHHLHDYNPSAAIGTAREFFWSELCDWYLELIKPRIKDEKTAFIACTVLALTIDHVLRLFHPFVPFITETLWEKLNQQAPVRGLHESLPGAELIAAAEWPIPHGSWEDESVEKQFELLREVIRNIRDLRLSHNVPPSKKIEAIIKAKGESAESLSGLSHLISNMVGLESLRIDPEAVRPPSSAIQVIGEMEIYLIGIIDADAEKQKLERQRDKLTKDLDRTRRKLTNRDFLEKAPDDVVAGERRKLDEMNAQLELIEKNLQALS